MPIGRFGDVEVNVIKILPGECKDWFLNKHYLKRMPPISFCYGLYVNDKLEGVVSFGKPASDSLCRGLCGEDLKSRVFELNRLVINEIGEKNLASFLIGGALRFLKKLNLIIVSYADQGWNHSGYVYQATNWIYTGSTLKRTDMWAEGHSRHARDPSIRKLRSPKHRYVYFAGDRRFKKMAKKALNYPEESYPKGENKRYDASYIPVTQEILVF